MDKITVSTVQQMKTEGKKITMLTLYDYPFTRILDAAGVDILLVGDSAGNAVAGYANTLPVTMEEILYHTRAVARAAQRAMVVGDMPFMSYQTSAAQARENTGPFLKEAGAHAVKLEGATNMEEVIRTIVDIDIPVMGHVGLAPQSVHRMGGFKVQGRDSRQRKQLLDDARAVECAGAFSVVLECVPEDLAEEITGPLSIPTIGIGAGVHCDGHVLVIHDLLGLLEGFRPRFVKQYVDMHETIGQAVRAYLEEVRETRFPGKEHTFQ